MTEDVDPTSRYLAWALDATPAERAVRARLLDRLPLDIIDVHSHANGRDAVGTISSYGRRQVRSSFPSWSLLDTESVRTMLFGAARVRSLVMAQPYRGIDHRKANAYLIDNVVEPDQVTLCGLPDDVSYSITEIQSNRYVALKTYPHQAEPPYTHIDEFFSPALVAAAAAARMPLILHLPAPLSACVDEVVALVERNPDARVVLAHLGRENAVTDEVVAAFGRVGALPSVAMDCSMVTVAAVHRLAFDALGPDRVLYGSDTPMNLLRFATFRHPKLGHRLISPHRYHWLDEDLAMEYRRFGDKAILAHWQVLDCLVESVDRQFPASADDVLDRVFRRNALAWFPLLAR